MDAAMIIGAEEVPVHKFVHGDEADTTYPKISSLPTIHQEGAIIIEKKNCGERERDREWKSTIEKERGVSIAQKSLHLWEEISNKWTKGDIQHLS